MRNFFLSIALFLAVPLGSLAAPADGVALQTRSEVHDAYTLMQQLYSDIKTHTGAINATAANITPKSSYKEKKAATAHVGAQIHHIAHAVKKASLKVAHLKKCSKGPLEARQLPPGPAGLAAIVELILLEISGALNGIIAGLGLQPLLAFLTPLVASLSALLLSLEAVVNNLLALVQALLDGLLTGLSVALAGLVL